jgi:hypothetical protein
MPSRPGRPVVALSLTLDDDSQGAQFRAPRIPNRALPKRGPFYAFSNVHVANGSTGRGAVLLPPSQSTKHPGVAPNNIKASKDFMRCVALGIEGIVPFMRSHAVEAV